MGLRKTAPNWWHCLPGIYLVPSNIAPPCIRRVQDTIGDVGCPELDGNCGYVGILAGLILLGLESHMDPIEFRRVLHNYASSHVDRLMALATYRETIAVHSGMNDLVEMKEWVMQSLLPNVWSTSLSGVKIVPVSSWLDFELVAPIVMVKYHVSLTLYSYGGLPDSLLTISYHLTEGEGGSTLSVETVAGLSIEAAARYRTITLLLWQGHYYVIRPRIRQPEMLPVDQGISDLSCSEYPAFSRFETSPRCAQLLWYANSDVKASGSASIASDDVAVGALKSAIRSEVLDETESDQLIREFLKTRGQDSSNMDGVIDRGMLILACGVCGKREPTSPGTKGFEAMRTSSSYVCEDSVAIDCSVMSRHRSAESNPVAGAIGFYRFISDIMSRLVCCPHVRYEIDDRQADRKTRHYRDRKGVFGYCRAYFGVVEAQGRGSLHFHVLIWGGLSPGLLEGLAHHPALREVVAEALDRTFSAELPRGIHVRDLIMRELRLEGHVVRCPPFCPALTASRSPLEDRSAYLVDCYRCICCNGIHRHRATCHSGRNGRHGCRFDFPCANQEKTCPFQLSVNERDEVLADSCVDRSTSSRNALFPSETRLIRWELRRPLLKGLQERSITDTAGRCLTRLTSAMDGGSDSCLVSLLHDLDDNQLFALYDRIQLQLPHRNEWVVPFSPPLTAAIRCHSAVVPLGGSTESRLASLYLVPYLNKNKYQLVHILTLAHQALLDVTRYPSSRHVAGESAEEFHSRNVQHFLTRLLNKLNVVSEVSDVQAASALLGYSVSLTSDSFVPYRASAAIGFLQLLRSGVAIKDIPCIVDIEDQDGGEENDTDSNLFVPIDSFGASEIVKIDESRRVIVSQPWLYEYRGGSLVNFNRLEYASLVGMKRKSEKRSHDGAGRPSFPRFPFDDACPLNSTHEQILYSVQKTPIVYGSIPKSPGSPPSPVDSSFLQWKSRADKFAQYYLATYRPEPIGSKTLRYDWDSFVSYVTYLQNSNDSIDQMRYHSLIRSVHKECVTPRMKDILSSYRARNRTVWKSSRRPSTSDSPNQLLMLTKKFIMQWEAENLSSSQIRNAWKMCDYVASQEKMVRTAQETSGGWRRGVCVLDVPVRTYNKLAAQTIMAGITSKIQSESNQSKTVSVSKNTIPCVTSGFDEFVANVVPLEHSGWALGDDQYRIMDFLHRQFNDGTHGGPVANPTLLLVTGRPGTGKSFVISMLQRMCSHCGLGTVVTTAYAGIAASHVGGQTICSLFQIPFPKNENEDDMCYVPTSIKPLDPICLQLLRDVLDVEHLRCLVIDEASTVTPVLLWIIHTRLRQATGLDLPFGGISILMFGDMKQLPPVKAISICQGAVEMSLYDENKDLMKQMFPPEVRRNFNRKYGPTSAIRQGLSLMRLFRWMTLETQYRSVDPAHTAFISKLWEGRPLVMRDLMQYRPFRSSDVDEDPSWLEAPLLVSTNQERLNMIHERAVTYAEANHTCVLRWPLEYTKWRGCPSDPEARDEALADPSFFEYFVSGAPGFVTTNICPRYSLANGSAIRYHSVTMASEEEDEILQQRINSSVPGSVLTIERPFSLNVELSLDPAWATSFEAALREVDHVGLPCISDRSPHTGLPTRAIIPISHSARNSEWHERSIAGNRGRGYAPSRVHVRDHIRCELGFAVTVHKAEGRTLSKMIVALAERPIAASQLTYTAVLVAMSRVRDRGSIRLLCDTDFDLRSLQYITALRPSPFVDAYFGGYTENGERWNADDMVSYVCAHFREYSLR